MNFENLSFSKSKSFGLLQFKTEDADTFEYVSSDFAIKNGFIVVNEVDEQGSVNNLMVLNTSPHFVFFMDGDVLVGAKQNRVLNTSVLLEPQSKTNITVSCIEQGRWQHKSVNFSKPDFIAPAKLRKQKNMNVYKSLKSGNSYYASQGDVWDNVSHYEKIYSVKSETSDLTEVMETKMADFDKYIKYFECHNEANGLAMFSEDKVVSVEIFNRTNVYREYFHKLLRATAMEVFYMNKKESKMQKDDAIDI
ncbi:MAG: ARPP-1 family domain-containing protein, partial [Ignavibacteria bacterium]